MEKNLTRLVYRACRCRKYLMQLASAQAEMAKLRDAVARAAAEKRVQEQTLDDLETKCRIALASEENARYCYLFYNYNTLSV